MEIRGEHRHRPRRRPHASIAEQMNVPFRSLRVLFGAALLAVSAALIVLPAAAEGTTANGIHAKTPARNPGQLRASSQDASGTRTFIYPRARPYGLFRADCGEHGGALECNAAWISIDRGRWAVRLNRHAWATGSESFRPAHIDTYARFRTSTLWSVSGSGKRTIRFHSRGRWDIYRGQKLIGFTKGPQGVAAGLMWLADPV